MDPAELPIREVDVPDPQHLRRSARYPGETDIAPEQAAAAALDPARLIARDPSSRTGESVRVLGYSAGAARVLVVVLLPEQHPPQGLWHVVTARPANAAERTAYYRTEDADG